MQNIEIIYPSIAMFALTGIFLLSLGISRLIALKQHKVSIKYYTKYNEGEQPERLHILGRHVQNHFEVPPLFHIVILFLFVTETATEASLIAAWGFVGFRCLHSLIHLGHNNVTHRFLSFVASLLCLVTLWACLLTGLLEKA